MANPYTAPNPMSLYLEGHVPELDNPHRGQDCSAACHVPLKHPPCNNHVDHQPQPQTQVQTLMTPNVNPELDQWIQYCLSQPHHPFVRLFLEGGMDEPTAKTLLRAIYNEAAAPWYMQLKKRDWLMNIYQTMAGAYATQQGTQSATVDRVATLTKEEFFNRYYTTNRPVVVTNAVDQWQAFSKWTPAYLKERCGDVEVEVQMDRCSNPRYELDKLAHAKKMKFGEYVDLVVNTPSSNDFYMTAYNSAQHDPRFHQLLEDLQYWPPFMDSQLNGRVFLWLGPAGTLTPYHHDLTNNFMVQIAGRKKITLFPSSAIPYMYNFHHCFSEMSVQNPPDYSKFPALQNTTPIEVILKPGEFFFLPIGWWHYIEAMDQSLTVTGTNFAFPNDFMAHYPQY